MKHHRILTSVVILLFVLLGFSYFYIDLPVASFFHQYDFRNKLSFLKPLILLGKWQIMLLFSALFMAYYYFVKPQALSFRRSLFVFAAIFVSSAICVILKISLGRARPDLWFEQGLYGFYYFKFHRPYWSFPSGHTTSFFSCMLALAILFPRYAFALISAGLLMAASRVIMYHHYLSDVLMAIGLVVIELGVLYHLFSRFSLLNNEVKP